MVSGQSSVVNGEWGTIDRCVARVLLTNPEALDQLGVAVGILALQIVEQPPALADELQQAAPRVVILYVRLEVLGQIVDAFTEERDLHFRGARVRFVHSVRAYDFRLTFVAQHRVSPRTAQSASLLDQTAVTVETPNS